MDKVEADIKSMTSSQLTFNSLRLLLMHLDFFVVWVRDFVVVLLSVADLNCSACKNVRDVLLIQIHRMLMGSQFSFCR